MITLAIDTSAGTSLALVTDAGVERRHSPDGRGHAEHLAPMLAELGLDGLERVVVGTGPAPFTGLRAGLVTAAAVGLARGVPVLGVSALDGVARLALDRGDPLVTVVTDARRKEVYSATYRARGEDDVERVVDLAVGKPEDVAVPEGASIVGAGTSLYPDALPGADLALDVAVYARIATARGASGTEMPTAPLYLRRPDIYAPAGRKRVI